MTDENPQAAPQTDGQPQQPAQPRLQILAQFVRDMSFENLVAQNGLAGADVKPEISVQVSLDARKRNAEGHYEIISRYRVESKNTNDSKSLFLCELEYGAVFHVSGIPDDQLHPFLMIECPRMVFPFARRIISDVTRDGGFPPVNLDPIDFVALYRQELARRAQSEKPADAPVS
ncbi:protein-export chaperone SecB [Paracoccus sp. SCSIO 75233]|uniref:protein-export chaperone SecB n=1 Tax=Paracoccus sp. SCSIO 75233 TaxID=3017782 RepID=UPI0022F03782|nr:protein-export chaperone SecB [Paracoccus sp. SCSIO 75233]WBU52891.1 protein-export chaperone SecB [Paracoccus sp. SCSIO 75233]